MINRIYLAGGCFWGVEGYFKRIEGVVDTECGYANGNTKNPSYEEVCRKNTGHAEAVRIDFDDNIISLEDLLIYYFRIIDPISVNKQGNDVGTQYRTGIYYTDEGQLPIINAALKREQEKYIDKIAVEVLEIENFYDAEEYHQNYLDKNPNGYCHINLEWANEPIVRSEN